MQSLTFIRLPTELINASGFIIETRSLPALARSCPRHFAFHAWRAVASVKAGRFSHQLHSTCARPIAVATSLCGPFDFAQGKLIGGYRTGINAACYRDAIRDSRIASFVARIRFPSGISNSLKVAVVSAGWRSLDAGAIVRGASLNAISSLLGNEKWGLIKYLTLIS